ncbi:hypothetical protein F5883DRAFT_609405 [Diaporthe sp. PMI_573]|nr:hypothetical protein F5883DRAFT_609405 [Diaporthaceae sp. PMI_573]
MSRKPICVAISGGGLAGATLFYALLKHPYLDGPNAGDEGVMIDEIDAKSYHKQVVSIVHRAAFLRELLANVPPGRMYASKKLVRVDCDEGAGPSIPMTLYFADGSMEECDVLISMDGIHSIIRGIILSKGDLAIGLQNIEWWAIIGLKPYAPECLKNAVEKEYPPARIYVLGIVAILGNAAHATTPWQGLGVGMAIEDSLILSTLLSSVTIIIKSSRGTGIMRTGLDKDVGLDLVKFQQRLLSRWDFIIDFDNESHCAEAMAIMNGLLQGRQ